MGLSNEMAVFDSLRIMVVSGVASEIKCSCATLVQFCRLVLIPEIKANITLRFLTGHQDCKWTPVLYDTTYKRAVGAVWYCVLYSYFTSYFAFSWVNYAFCDFRQSMSGVDKMIQYAPSVPQGVSFPSLSSPIKSFYWSKIWELWWKRQNLVIVSETFQG